MRKEKLLAVGKYREVAVMLCFYEEDGIDYLVFEKRAPEIPQGGEISFPGGKRDAKDRDLKETALRETREELGLKEEEIRYLDYEGQFIGRENLHLELHSCRLQVASREEVQPNPSEVASLLFVPLEFFQREKPKIEIIEQRKTVNFDCQAYGLPERYWDLWSYQEREAFFYFYGGEVIWGLTAEILVAYLERQGRKE